MCEAEREKRKKEYTAAEREIGFDEGVVKEMKPEES